MKVKFTFIVLVAAIKFSCNQEVGQLRIGINDKLKII